VKDTRRSLRKKKNNMSRKTLFVLIFVLTAISLGGYSYYQTQGLLRGPELTITKPGQGEIFTTPLIIIEGKTLNISHISLNNRDIFVNEKGVFEEQLLLAPGYTIMEIAIEDRFGRERTERLHLFLKNKSTLDI